MKNLSSRIQKWYLWVLGNVYADFGLSRFSYRTRFDASRADFRSKLDFFFKIWLIFFLLWDKSADMADFDDLMLGKVVSRLFWPESNILILYFNQHWKFPSIWKPASFAFWVNKLSIDLHIKDAIWSFDQIHTDSFWLQFSWGTLSIMKIVSHYTVGYLCIHLTSSKIILDGLMILR